MTSYKNPKLRTSGKRDITEAESLWDSMRAITRELASIYMVLTTPIHCTHCVVRVRQECQVVMGLPLEELQVK